jgi:hypothetical protein
MFISIFVFIHICINIYNFDHIFIYSWRNIWACWVVYMYYINEVRVDRYAEEGIEK